LGKDLLDRIVSDPTYVSLGPANLYLQAPMLTCFMQCHADPTEMFKCVQSKLFIKGTLAWDTIENGAYIVIDSNIYTVKLWRMDSMKIGAADNLKRYLRIRSGPKNIVFHERAVTDHARYKAADLVASPPSKTSVDNFDAIDQVPVGFSFTPSNFKSVLEYSVSIAMPDCTVAIMREIVSVLALEIRGAAAKSESELLRAIIMVVFPLATDEMILGILKMRAEMKVPPDGGDCWCADADSVDLMAGLVEDDELEVMEAFAKDVGMGKKAAARAAHDADAVGDDAGADAPLGGDAAVVEADLVFLPLGAETELATARLCLPDVVGCYLILDWG
jgi:hypothetical protein